ncbi:Cytochrome P450 83B1 [Senna tora]|uniref:Cytochrome P450 83B1 n=1 Tax=Senna tora TaxID=362788 RepID=A0A834WBW7_9FABA|nr:Cytochrome P450 83B1 [Senna tora]
MMGDTALLALILCSLIFVLLFIHRKRTRATLSLPPGPPGLPLIGNFLHFHNSAPHRHLCHLSNHYGPLMSLRLGMKPALIVSSARMATQIMKTHDLTFATRPSLLGQQKLSYNGLDLAFAPYTHSWKEMKKLSVLHFFNSRRIHSFSPVREDEVMRMITKISQSHTRLINLSETSMSFTSSLICRMAFGKRYEEDQQGNERSRFHGLLNEAQAMMAEFFFSDYIPCLAWVDRLTGLLWRLDNTFNQLDMFYEQVIQDHLNPTKSNSKSNQQDIIDIFLGIIDAHDNSLPFHLTMDHLKALLMNIVVAGTDTGAAIIVWVMTLLMKNPKEMKKAQDEIRSVYGEKDFIREEDIQRLPYLKAIVKETLRLFPPTPLLLPRESMQKCNIEGYEIQPKTLVFVNVWAIGRDPETWEDAEEFNPERFFKCEIDFKGQDFELIPFGAGRRMCPAIQMGMVAVHLALANLLHSFDWDLPDGVRKENIDTQVKPGLTMHKKYDLCLLAHNHIKTTTI